jgi:BirA family transcriptional regulator, biotin operon repressor / biotin---[acetyl-CoA-carboxylase] ligase
MAVRDGLAALAPRLRFMVKWPNDVLAGRQGVEGKIAGVLTEASASGESLEWVIVGVGVNLESGVERLVRDADPPPVSLQGLGAASLGAEVALQRILEAFDAFMQRHKTPQGLMEQVQEVLAYRGEAVRLVLRDDDESISGRLIGVDASGRAVVITEEGERAVEPWDVEHLRWVRPGQDGT